MYGAGRKYLRACWQMAHVVKKMALADRIAAESKSLAPAFVASAGIRELSFYILRKYRAKYGGCSHRRKSISFQMHVMSNRKNGRRAARVNNPMARRLNKCHAK